MSLAIGAVVLPARTDGTQPFAAKVATGPDATTPSPAPVTQAQAVPPPPAAGALISATFQQLGTADPAAATAADPAAKSVASGALGAPTTHFVQTTTIHAATPDPAEAVAAPAPQIADADVASVDAAPGVGTDAGRDVAPQIDVPVPLPPTPKRAEASGPTRSVGGSGVTVRAAPSKTGSALFNLSAGERVTVVGRQGGWAQIVDSDGRRGWAYANLLGRS